MKYFLIAVLFAAVFFAVRAILRRIFKRERRNINADD